MSDRISTISIFNTTIRNFGVVQGDIAELTRQISSGREAKDFKGLGTKTRLILDLESKLSSAKRYVGDNNIALVRLNGMKESIGSLLQIATSLRNNITIERSAAQNDLPLAELSRAQLSQVRDALNKSISGRFLFSGARTDDAPVGDIVNVSNLSPTTGLPTANYYLGDDGAVEILISDQLTINYGITANNDSIQKLVGALHMAINAEGASDGALESALDLVNEALEGVVGLENEVNNNIQIISSTNDIHENFKTYLNQTLGEEVGVDVVEATTQLSLNQTLLQATFQNFARISNLKLVDFLR